MVCSRTNANLRSANASSPSLLKNMIQTEAERMRTIGRRLGSRHILWLPHVTGDSTCKIIDLVKVSLDRFRYGVEEEMLEAFTDKWYHVLAAISVDRPDDGMLRALFYEQVQGAALSEARHAALGSRRIRPQLRISAKHLCQRDYNAAETAKSRENVLCYPIFPFAETRCGSCPWQPTSNWISSGTTILQSRQTQFEKRKPFQEIFPASRITEALVT